MQKFKFKKEERLCSEKLLALLFKDGSSFLFYPFRITWLKFEDTDGFPVKVLIGVPKKRFKRSVDRNLLKRRIREAYRLNKSTSLYPFLQEINQHIFLALNYVGKEKHDFDYISTKLQKALLTLEKQIKDA